MKKIILSLFSALILLTSVHGYTWTSSSGKTFKGELVEANDENATIRRTSDRKKFTVAITSLSEADQEYIKKFLEENASEKTIPIKNGEKIAFLGDSITAAGAKPGGYCQLVIEGLKEQGIEVTGAFAGISGHKSNQMLERLERDVLSKKPNWMTLSCGVNDVWHGARGVSLEDYKKNITEIVDQAQAADIKVMLLTSTMIREDSENELNKKLAPYNEFIRELAKEKNCLLADLNTEMQETLKTFPEDEPKGKQLTGDGVHMNALGNKMMANGILKSFSVEVK